MTDKQTIEKLKIENEKLKADLKSLEYTVVLQGNRDIDNATDLFAKRIAKIENENSILKAELEQEKSLKEMYFTYYKAKHSDIKGEFFKLQAENEELNREKRNFYKFLTDKYNYGSFKPMWGAYLLKRFFNEDLGDFFNEAAYKMTDTIEEKEKQIDKYSQTLTEIEEIARWHTTSTDSEGIQDDMKQILQLISEVEDDRQD